MPVLHDVEKLHADVCQAVETKTVGAPPYVLTVTNPFNPGSSLYWTDDDGNPLIEDGSLILWSV